MQRKKTAQASSRNNQSANTSDSDSRLTLQGSLKSVESASTLTIAVLSILYGLSSSGNTFTSKLIYHEFGDISPLSLLMVQCLLNVVICVTLMTIKECRVSSFSKLKRYGIQIPELNKVSDKMSIGVRVGAANVATVVFGIYAIKHSSLSL